MVKRSVLWGAGATASAVIADTARDKHPEWGLALGVIAVLSICGMVRALSAEGAMEQWKARWFVWRDRKNHEEQVAHHGTTHGKLDVMDAKLDTIADRVSPQSVAHPPAFRQTGGMSRIGTLDVTPNRGAGAVDLSNANIEAAHVTIRRTPEPRDWPVVTGTELPDLPFGSFEELSHSAKILAAKLHEREQWYYQQWKQVMARGNQRPSKHSAEGLEAASAKSRVTQILEERKKAEYLGLFSGPAYTLWSRLCLDLGLSKDDPRFAGSPFLTSNIEGEWTMARVAEELTRLATRL
jgi:hypothetical protein